MSLLRTELMCCVLLCHEGIQRSRALGQCAAWNGEPEHTARDAQAAAPCLKGAFVSL